MHLRHHHVQHTQRVLVRCIFNNIMCSTVHEYAPRDSRRQSVKSASPTWLSLCVRADIPKNKLILHTCKRAKMLHFPRACHRKWQNTTRITCCFFPIREAHNPLQIPRLLPRVTSKTWRAATFHFRPGGIYIYNIIQNSNCVHGALSLSAVCWGCVLGRRVLVLSCLL